MTGSSARRRAVTFTADLRQDLRDAWRAIRRAPGHAGVAIATLGIAIGVNAGVVTVLNAVFVRPWPVPNAARVVSVARGPLGRTDLSIQEYRYLAAHQHLFSGLVAERCLNGWDSNCTVEIGSGAAHAGFVSTNYFDVLGVAMDRGRAFQASDDGRDAVVISYRTWKSALGGADDVIGRRLPVDGVPLTIVGVASREFTGTRIQEQDAWIPISSMLLLRPFDPDLRDAFDQPGFCCARVAGRLLDGISREQARADLDVLSREFRTAFAPDKLANGPVATAATSLSPAFRQSRVWVPFALILAGGLMLLLLACANVGNLSLARALARRSEIATRLALGASRNRVVRQLLTEHLVIASAASGVGLAFASILPARLLPFLASDAAGVSFAPDGLVFGVTAGLAVLTCACFGVAPAVLASRVDLVSALKVGQARGARRAGGSLRGALLAVQVGVSVVLLCSSGLMARGVELSARESPGLALDDVAIVSTALPASSDPARRRALRRDLAVALESFQGAAPWGLTTLGPFTPGGTWSTVQIPGAAAGPQTIVPVFFQVSAGYFDTLRIPILAGSNFAAGDGTRHAIIINETMARAAWPGANALGRIVLRRADRVSYEVVGVARDADTDDDVLDHEVAPTMYMPMDATDDGRFPSVVVRDPTGSMAHAIGAMVTRIDPQARVQIATLSDTRASRLTGAWVAPGLASGLGLLALAFATIGVFGVFAYLVEQRTREIGIRRALGAGRWHVIRLVLSGSARAMLIGTTAGVVGARAAARILRGYLYGAGPLDPVAYAGAAAVLCLAGLVASYVPARRAMRIEPVIALKAE